MAGYRTDLLFFSIRAGGEDGMITINTKMRMKPIISISRAIPSKAAGFLIEKRNINGIGIDTLSADYGVSTDFAVHHIINGAGKYILENVKNLDKLPPTGAILIIAPIKIEGGSGGQTRIWAILPSH